MLHGYWITGDDSGVDVFGVSADLEYLRGKMKSEAGKILEAVWERGTEFKVENVEESGTKYEVEGEYGDMIKLYITEHEVEKGTEEAC